MDMQRALLSSTTKWNDDIVPRLMEYIRIPNVSPAFDPEWEANGHMDAAVDLLMTWAKAQPTPGMTVEKIQLKNGDKNRTPLIFIEIPASDLGEGTTNTGTVMMYGHLDKQPEMKGWNPGLGAWTPVLDGDDLFGRGAADDGYAMFASLEAILLLIEQGLPHGRIVVLIEACEESGSKDLLAYMDALADRIGTPDLVICLDSGCGNYDQLWLTATLRGIVIGDLNVRVLDEGVHSGDASGIVPSPFRLTTNLIGRIESSGGMIRLPELHIDIPDDRRDQTAATADVLGPEVYSKFPWRPGCRPDKASEGVLLFRRTWRPQLTVTMIKGYPTIPEDAGNVMLPYMTTRLSVRLPPTVGSTFAGGVMKQVLEADSPNGAEVTFTVTDTGDGWNAPMLAPWLEKSLNEASITLFGKPLMMQGEGGSIPFMAMLGERFPGTQFVVTGVLGPHSNAHGPNEFLRVPYAVRVTVAMAFVITSHATHR